MTQILKVTPIEKASRSDQWQDALLCDDDGKPYGHVANVLAALRGAPDLCGITRFNEFRQEIEFCKRPPWRDVAVGAVWEDQDTTQLQSWLQSNEVDIRQSNAVWDAIAVVARDTLVHPVRAFLAGLQWDGQSRLDEWLSKYLSARGDPAYLAAVGRKFLISAVARIYVPGCQVDHTLVLEGQQGVLKSSLAQRLATRFEWFTDSLPALHSKDAALQLRGRWIVELGEMSALRRNQLDALKAFLTRRYDVLRPPYGRATVSSPRQNVFIATTNESEYLRDSTGNRRFWPVKCGRSDMQAMERDLAQLWAEAVHCYLDGEIWYLTADEELLAAREQEARRFVTQLEETVIRYLDGLPPTQEETDTRDILIYACGLDPEKPDYIERAGRIGPEVAEALRLAGWERVGPTGRGRNRRNLYRRTHRGS